MKKILAIIALSLCLMIPSKADEIKDLQIEGMSIGDSALNFFSESLIKNGTKKNPVNSANQKYEVTSIYTKGTGNYINVADFDFAVFEAVEITYKKNDRNYIIEGIAKRKKGVNHRTKIKILKNSVLFRKYIFIFE